MKFNHRLLPIAFWYGIPSGYSRSFSFNSSFSGGSRYWMFWCFPAKSWSHSVEISFGGNPNNFVSLKAFSTSWHYNTIFSCLDVR